MLSAIIERLPSGVVVTLRGELDLMSSELLGSQLRGLLAEGQGFVVADLRELGFLDASGLRALVGAAGQCAAAGVGFAIACARPNIRRVLDLVRTGADLPVRDDLASALEVAAHGPDRTCR